MQPAKAGSRYYAKNLANSLRAVAAGGAETFYRGELAERIVNFLTKEGGSCPAQSRLNVQIPSACTRVTSAPWSQPKTTIPDPVRAVEA